VGYCGCKGDYALWEKRSMRDALSIEIAVDVLRLSAGVVRVHYRTAALIFLTRKYLREFTIESCLACSHWSRCVPTLYEHFSRIHRKMVDLRDSILESPPITHIPFVFPVIKESLAQITEMLSERVENLSFIKDEDSRSALRDLGEACKDAGPNLDDWRKSMDFLN
jgi:hypothetical protein